MIPFLYVFVEIQIDVQDMVDCLQVTLLQSNNDCQDVTRDMPHVYLLGTIQFQHALPEAKDLLHEMGRIISIPQVKPLSPGEVLGCTSPTLDQHDEDRRAIVCFVADGRFYWESTLISNPHIDAFYR